MCDKYHQNVVQRIQFISLKTHRESLILILCYLGTWLQLNQTYSAVRYQHCVTSCFIWDAEKRWPVGSGQWRSLKQVIKGAMKDEEVNKVTKKKFKRNKTPNSVVSSVLLLLLVSLIPSSPFRFPLSFTKTVPVWPVKWCWIWFILVCVCN